MQIFRNVLKRERDGANYFMKLERRWHYCTTSQSWWGGVWANRCLFTDKAPEYRLYKSSVPSPLTLASIHLWGKYLALQPLRASLCSPANVSNSSSSKTRAVEEKHLLLCLETGWWRRRGGTKTMSLKQTVKHSTEPRRSRGDYYMRVWHTRGFGVVHTLFIDYSSFYKSRYFP